jgi:tetratricopeptide (TPR) repeat protein
VQSYAQTIDSKFAIAEANKSYEIGDYKESIEKYNSANKLDTSNNISFFNAGNAAFMNDEFEEANNYYNEYLNQTVNDNEKAEALYNIGNSYFNDYKKNNNQESLTKSIESYKKSLRLNSKDTDTRYNLSHAMRIAKQQENQDQQNKDQQNKDQENKDQKNKDQKNKDQKNKDQEDQENQNQENKDQKEKGEKDKSKEKQQPKENNKESNKENEQKQPPKQGQEKPSMEQKQALKYLDAINTDEEKVLLKVNRQKGDEKKASKTKDW